MTESVIISDTSCLIALDLINSLDILHQIFPAICTTPEVEKEFGGNLPKWIQISPVKNANQKFELEKLLDRGEASAIALAIETPNSVLIIDEKKGRRIARQFHVEIIGTLKILLIAKEKGAIKSVKQEITKLHTKGFRFSSLLLEEVLAQAGEL